MSRDLQRCSRPGNDGYNIQIIVEISLFLGSTKEMKQGLLVVSDLLAFALTPSLHTQAPSLDTSFSTEFAEQDFMAYTVNGEATGLYQNAGTFSYLRVHGADTKFLRTRVLRRCKCSRRSCQTSRCQARDV